MSKNKAGSNIIKEVGALQRNLNIQQTNYWRGRHRIVMLTDRVAVTAATVTSSSDIGWTDVDMTSYVSANTFAVILAVFLSDTASATTECYVKFRENGSSSDGTGFVYGIHLNSQWSSNQLIIPVDSNLTMEYNLNATGSNTATLSTYIIGYIERLK
jgi:hypothetical protein